MLAWIVHSLLFIGSVVCFVLVVIQMFQRGQTGLGVATIILAFCGIGFLIAFIVGWINSTAWGIRNVMIAWTVIVILNIILNFALPIPIPGFGPAS
jgi:hypothetical protein